MGVLEFLGEALIWLIVIWIGIMTVGVIGAGIFRMIDAFRSGEDVPDDDIYTHHDPMDPGGW